jgi:hypothetical protein
MNEPAKSGDEAGKHRPDAVVHPSEGFDCLVSTLCTAEINQAGSAAITKAAAENAAADFIRTMRAASQAQLSQPAPAAFPQ